MKKRILIGLVLIAIFHTISNAQVNIKNGNFYVSYTDVSFRDSEGAIDNLTRTYNSKSTEVGWFGYGWGTQLESSLYLYPDYTVQIKEYGAGGKTLFKSAFQDEQFATDMIEFIIDLQLENDLLDDNPATIAERRKSLADPEKRYQYYDNLVDKKLVEPIMEVPEGITWQSFDRGDQQLTYNNGSFLRTSRSGLKESFNLNGQLIKLEEKNGYYTEVFYENGHPKKIKNRSGYLIVIKTNDEGLISQLNTSLGKEAKYKYDGDYLLFSEGTRYNQYKYEYDGKHNMTATIYNPVRFKGEKIDQRTMEYWPKSSYTKRIVERDSTIKNYSYPTYYDATGAVDDLHYGTAVLTQYPDGRDDKNVSYEYFIGTKADGSTFTQKIITTSNGYVSTSTYDETCSYQPIRIEQGELWTTFVYDKNCNLIEKEKSTGELLRLKYHPTLKKMIQVQQDDNLFIYKYDDYGNITYGKKNDEPPVELVYNEENKIVSMINDDVIMDFEYNTSGKPIKIIVADLGTVNVTYDNRNEIERVESPEGYKVTMQITQAYQNLLDIVKPANLDYNL
jgi:hypothetical protein